MGCEQPRLMDIGRIADTRGNLSVIDARDVLDFVPLRCYWLNDIPGGEYRDGHAYHSARELIVALSGSLTVKTESSTGIRQRFILDRPDMALLLPPHTWRQLTDFTTNASAMVLSSTLYDPDDYIRDHNTFTELTSRNGY